MDGFLKFFEGFGIDSRYILVVFGIFALYVVFTTITLPNTVVFSYVFATAPIWLPVTTFLLLFKAWLEYVRAEWNFKRGRVTLEIKIPQEVFKSPEAMELVITQMYQTASPDNHLQTYRDGKHAPKFGLEIVSRGGDVRFYINTPIRQFKNIIETQLYAQYPGIEVHQLDVDYAAEIPWDESKFSYFSIHFGLKKPDAYPLKTYIDYGLLNMPKEEEKVDPLTVILENLGSIGQGEYVWVQILIEANQDLKFKNGSLQKVDEWKVDAKKEIATIIQEAAARVGIKKDELKEKGTNMNQLLTTTEKDKIDAIERSLGKPGFNTAIRVMYIAKKEAFNGERISSLITMWRAYDDYKNGIGFKWRTDFDWPMIQDPTGKRVRRYKMEELDRYKRRYFEEYIKGAKTTVLTTEELATIFHLPGKVATTPTLGRIPSKRAEAPSNLPV